MRLRRVLKGMAMAAVAYGLAVSIHPSAGAQPAPPALSPDTAASAFPASSPPPDGPAAAPSPIDRHPTPVPRKPPAPAMTPRSDLLLHSFPSSQSDGIFPRGSVLAAGSSLYGRTAASKAPLAEEATAAFSGPGSLFMYTPRTRQYTVLHVFLGSPDARDSRHGSLTQVGNVLYGTTQNGGTYDKGAIFTWDLRSGEYAVVYSFTGGLDGSEPHNGFVQDPHDPSVLYGTAGAGGTRRNGVYPSKGTIFSFNIRTDAVTTMFRFDDPALGAQPHGRLTLGKEPNVLYGMARFGGTANKGVIYRINTDGTNYTVLHDFTGGYDDGATSQHGRLLELNGKLYGMTTYGGSGTRKGKGIAFSVNVDGSKFTVLHRFGEEADGAEPYASFVNIGTMLYGTTRDGGRKNLGTVFGMRLDGSDYAIVHDFTGAPGDGAHPIDEAVPFNGYLWVLTSTGGATDRGAMCAIQLR